ncbi:MAG: 4-hydroxy-tetrahydrodipicolinate reductase [Rhodospirillaceae bacterium TMED167]|nr:4-hydroxy-tetrahydrodipicolinate reductase [Rhodospirillaceae bacterium]OUW24837.1 MAG: 4-hydroxy-tetrahydrodipicolinate reductase [Rhodospirillaceae bacterium TMED167]
MKIGITGCAGRMGQMLVREVHLADNCTLAGGTEETGHTALGQDIAETAGLDACGIAIMDDSDALFAAADAIIDFTIAPVTGNHTSFAKKHATNLILGTTGHDGDQLASIEAAAMHIPIVKAMNFSVGVNVLFALTKQLAGTLDEDFDIEIVEMHHRHKVDAPSGTALGLAQAAADGRGVDLNNVADRGRDGITGPRQRGNIGLAALRGGDVVGEHDVVFAGASERIKLSHIATSREIFAKGAVRAALWSKGADPGLYDMLDVLGFSGRNT